MAKKKRVTLDLSEEFFGRLEALENRVEAGSKANVIRQSLQLYEAVVDQQAEGSRFYMIDPAGNKERVMIIGAPSPLLKADAPTSV